MWRELITDKQQNGKFEKKKKFLPFYFQNFTFVWFFFGGGFKIRKWIWNWVICQFPVLKVWQRQSQKWCHKINELYPRVACSHNRCFARDFFFFFLPKFVSPLDKRFHRMIVYIDCQNILKGWKKNLLFFENGWFS